MSRRPKKSSRHMKGGHYQWHCHLELSGPSGAGVDRWPRVLQRLLLCQSKTEKWMGKIIFHQNVWGNVFNCSLFFPVSISVNSGWYFLSFSIRPG